MLTSFYLIFISLHFLEADLLPHPKQIHEFSLPGRIKTKIGVNGLRYLVFNKLDMVGLKPLIDNGTKLVSVQAPFYEVNKKFQIDIPDSKVVDLNSPELPLVYILQQDLSLLKYEFKSNSQSFKFIEKSDDKASAGKNFTNASITICKSLDRLTRPYTFNATEQEILLTTKESLTYVNPKNISQRNSLQRSQNFSEIIKISCENNKIFALTNISTIETYHIVNETLSFIKSWNMNDLALKSVTDMTFDGKNSMLFIADETDGYVKPFNYGANNTLVSIPALEIKGSNLWKIFWDSDTLFIFEKNDKSVNLFEWAIDTKDMRKTLNRGLSVYFIPEIIDIEPNFIAMKGVGQISVYRRFVNYFLTTDNSLLLSKVDGDFGEKLQIVESGSFTAEVFSIEKWNKISMKTLNYFPASLKIFGDTTKENRFRKFDYPFQMKAINCKGINDTTLPGDLGVKIPAPTPNPRSWTGCIQNITLNVEFYNEKTSNESKAWVAGLVIGLLLIFSLVTIVFCHYYREAKRKQDKLKDRIDIYSSNGFVEFEEGYNGVLSPANSTGKPMFSAPKPNSMATAKFQEQTREVDENVINFEIQQLFPKNMEKKIEILEESENFLKFTISGIELSMANSLRRIMISEIPTMAIDLVNIHVNSSSIHDEYICHRLGMIPLVSVTADNFAYHRECDCHPCNLSSQFSREMFKVPSFLHTKSKM